MSSIRGSIDLGRLMFRYMMGRGQNGQQNWTFPMTLAVLMKDCRLNECQVYRLFDSLHCYIITAVRTTLSYIVWKSFVHLMYQSPNSNEFEHRSVSDYWTLFCTSGRAFWPLLYVQIIDVTLHPTAIHDYYLPIRGILFLKKNKKILVFSV